MNSANRSHSESLAIALTPWILKARDLRKHRRSGARTVRDLTGYHKTVSGQAFNQQPVLRPARRPGEGAIVAGISNGSFDSG